MTIEVPDSPKFLIIRRDNIGDLVCTTPLIRMLREKFPGARIDALVNSYNEPVLEGNPDVDQVYSYVKAKHREHGVSVFRVYWNRLKLIFKLRANKYDYAIIASTHFLKKPLLFARQVKPAHIVGFVEGKDRAERFVDIPVPYKKVGPMHLVEELEALLKPFGISGPMVPMHIHAAPEAVSAARNKLQAQSWNPELPAVALHISARKIPQRWSEENFVALIRRMTQQPGLQILLFWSPGDESNPLHPGDDQKAARILSECGNLPVFGFPTHTLSELIAGLSLCRQMICSDGGAMHVGAALGLSIVCMFGNSDATVWYPWAVQHRLLQKPSRNVLDISVDEVFSAWGELDGAAVSA